MRRRRGCVGTIEDACDVQAKFMKEVEQARDSYDDAEITPSWL